MKKIQHYIEFIALKLLFAAFRILPLDVASYVGGFMARAIGPFLGAHKTASHNLSMIFPQMDAPAKRKLLTRMWDNLGRVAAELPYIASDQLYERIEIAGREHLPVGGKPVIFFSGHLGNWELSYPIVHRSGIPVTLIYRQANNAYVDDFIAKLRSAQAEAILPKGGKGSIRLLRAIKEGHSLAMLVDQKMNDGIAVPFFGREAMTAPAMADLSMRYHLPLIPGKVVRTKGVHFKATIYPPLDYTLTGDEKADILAIMTQVNATLESWIRETPEQWFWVHRRWPSGER